MWESSTHTRFVAFAFHLNCLWCYLLNSTHDYEIFQAFQCPFMFTYLLPFNFCAPLIFTHFACVKMSGVICHARQGVRLLKCTKPFFVLPSEFYFDLKGCTEIRGVRITN